jgi:aminopeptidase N
LCPLCLCGDLILELRKMYYLKLFGILAIIAFASGITYGGEKLSKQEPAVGISRELARSRAERYRDLRYRVSFALVPGAEQLEGSTEIDVTLDKPDNMVVDFKGLGDKESTANGMLREVKANGKILKNYQQVNGHILIPAEALRSGENRLAFRFETPARKSGAAITRYLDRDDKSEYLYTLFVPSDAHMAFPCFDQPDLKARFTLEVTAPEDWTVVTNTLPEGKPESADAGYRRIRFQETKPLSTYLFAFAAGPFLELQAEGGDVPMRVFARRSKEAKARAELDEIVRINRIGIQSLAQYFDYPYPFTKYDLVILPEFAYGGMEHAGATFFREDRVLFPNDPTPNDLISRTGLMLHEAAHQWFGDLVTMRWFDDLWLKEGFATFMAYRAMETVLPRENVWKSFYQANKPRAYYTDSTKGTTPIYQEIPNLKDAKSAYGNIVYTKAPSMLRQFEFYLGPDLFKTGVRRFLKEHAFSNAEWSDLIRACEQASKLSLSEWADVWVKKRGMAAIKVDWSTGEDGLIKRLVIKQQPVLGEGGIWPMRIEVLLAYEKNSSLLFSVMLTGETTEVTAAAGKPRPDYIFANYEDYGYGRFMLDEQSLAMVKEKLPLVKEEFLRALLWGALWDAVRETEMAPMSYLELACAALPSERDPQSVQTILTNVSQAFTRYLSQSQQAAIAPKLEAILFDRLLKDEDAGIRVTYFRFAPQLATTEEGRQRLKEILSGKLAVPGITLKPRDRWDIVTSLLAQGDRQAIELLTAEQQRDQSDDGRRYAFVAGAARQDAAVKKEYFGRYLNDRELAENWIETSLRAFNSVRQSDLTLPYLKAALDALPALKRQRKIFFINEWLDAFISGQQSGAALDTVQEYLKRENLERDLRLKVLEAIDRLERSVKIRAKFAR